MNLGPASSIFSRMSKIPQVVVNELIWQPEATARDRLSLLSGQGLSQARLNILAAKAASRQRSNSAGRALARALLALVKG